MTEQRGNGNGNGWRSIMLAAVATVAFATMGFGWTSNYYRLEAIAATQQARGERIAKAEAEIASLRETLARIEIKLDRILEERRSK